MYWETRLVLVSKECMCVCVCVCVGGGGGGGGRRHTPLEELSCKLFSSHET